MRVSVLMPAYNAEAAIGVAIQSVIDQTHSDWELVVIDDGSTDSTAAIVARYVDADPRIRLLHQENAGESGARNTALEHANNDWVLFLDSDDWIDSRHLEKVTAKAASDPSIDAVVCRSVRMVGSQPLEEEYQPPEGDLFPVLARRAAFTTHSCLFRRSLVDRVGNFDTSLRKSADWDFWQRIARAGARFASVPEVLAYYRVVPSSSSMGAVALFQDGLRVLHRGHSADQRVENPVPEYAHGLSSSKVEQQVYYLLSWCAGILLGQGSDPGELLREARGYVFPELHAKSVARCVFESAVLPRCQTYADWIQLWPELCNPVHRFFEELEAQSGGSPGLAREAFGELKRMVLTHSEQWRDVVRGYAAEVARLQEHLQDADSRFGEQLRRAEELQVQGQDKSAQIEVLSKTVTSQSRLIDDQTARIEELSRNLAVQLDNNADLQQTVSERSARIQDMEIRASEVRNYLEELESRANHLERAHRDQAAEIQDLTVEYDGVNRSMTALEVQVRSLEETRWTRIGRLIGAAPKRPAMKSTVPRFGASGDSLPEWWLRIQGENRAWLLRGLADSTHLRLSIGRRSESASNWDIQLNRHIGCLKPGSRPVLSFQAKADAPRRLSVGVSQASAPWSGLGLYQTVSLTPEWSQHTFTFEPEGESPARLHFDAGESAASLEIRSVVVRMEEGIV